MYTQPWRPELMSAFDPNHPLSSDFSDPRQILDRLRGQTQPGFFWEVAARILGAVRSIFRPAAGNAH
jgi:hypothetical protein